MRLSFRIFALFFAGFLVLLAADSYLLVKREMQLLDRDMERDAVHLARTYGQLLQQAARLQGTDHALDLVERMDRDDQDVRVRWTWLDPGALPRYAPQLDRQELAPVLAGEGISIKKPGPDGSGFRVTYLPLTLAGQKPGALELTESLEPLRSYRRLIIHRSLGLGLVMAALGLGLSLIVGVRLLGRPLDLLRRQAERIGAGDLSGELRLRGRGELSDLAGAMDSMRRQIAEAQEALQAESKARIDALEQLRHTERLAVLGRISSGLAHELGTPLNVVSGRAQMIASGELDAEEIADCTRIIRRQAERMTGIIRQLLDYARRPTSRRRLERIGNLAAGVIRMLEPTARSSGVELVLEAADDLPEVMVDRAQLDQVLTNLVINAVHAMPTGGVARIAIARQRWARTPDPDHAGPQNTVDGISLRIEDEGVGIDPKDLPQVFEPFFTTKETGKGTGLGLSIVKDIVEEHGGRIEVASEKDRGTVFTVLLPLEVGA